MASETTSVQLSHSLSLTEMEELYEAERQKAALIHPRLVFRQRDPYSFEVGFHPKHRTWTGIDRYKALVEMAIHRRYPNCRVL